MKTTNPLSKLHRAYTAVDGWCWRHKTMLIAAIIVGTLAAITLAIINHKLK